LKLEEKCPLEICRNYNYIERPTYTHTHIYIYNKKIYIYKCVMCNILLSRYFGQENLVNLIIVDFVHLKKKKAIYFFIYTTDDSIQNNNKFLA